MSTVVTAGFNESFSVDVGLDRRRNRGKGKSLRGALGVVGVLVTHVLSLRLRQKSKLGKSGVKLTFSLNEKASGSGSFPTRVVRPRTKLSRHKLDARIRGTDLIFLEKILKLYGSREKWLSMDIDNRYRAFMTIVDYFFQSFFKELNSLEYMWHQYQRDWFNALEKNTSMGMFDPTKPETALQPPDCVQVEASRQIGKSYFIYVYALIMQLLRIQMVIIYMSFSDDLTKNHLVRYKNILYHNDVLSSYMLGVKSKKKRITEKRNKRNDKLMEFENGTQLQWAHMLTPIRGKTATMVICDDIQPGGVRSTNVVLYDRIYDFLEYDLFPILKTLRGKFVNIGTPMHGMDIIHRYREDERFTCTYHPVWDEDQVPIARFLSVEDLKQIQKANPLVFEQEYLLNPVGDTFQMISKETLDRNWRSFDHYVDTKQVRYIFMGVDPSPAVSDKSDPFAVVVMAALKDKTVCVVETYSSIALNPNQQIHKILDMYHTYVNRGFTVEYVNIESNAFQHFYHETLIKEAETQRIPRHKFIAVPTTEGKHSIYSGIAAIPLYVRDSSLLFNRDEGYKPSIDLLFRELINWKEQPDGKYKCMRGHDDISMACWIGLHDWLNEIESRYRDLQIVAGKVGQYGRQINRGRSGDRNPREASRGHRGYQ